MPQELYAEPKARADDSVQMLHTVSASWLFLEFFASFILFQISFVGFLLMVSYIAIVSHMECKKSRIEVVKINKCEGLMESFQQDFRFYSKSAIQHIGGSISVQQRLKR